MFYRYGLIVLTISLLLGNVVHAASVDKVVAVVNDDVITQIELESRMKGLNAEIAARGTDSPPKEELRRQLLDNMINDRLQLQAAQRLGISISDQDLDGAVMTVAQSNRMTLRQLRSTLAEQGIPYRVFRERVKTDLVIRQIFNRHIRNRIVVTDEELDDFISKGGGKADARSYDVSHILIRVPETASPSEVDEAESKAQDVLSRLSQGMKFSEAAARYSDAPDGKEGGNLGWRDPEQLPELFTQALSAIEVGQNTDILKSANGFHILHINEARGVNATTVAQTNVRHILLRTDEFLSEAEAKHRIEQLRERIVNGEDFTALARVHSDDPISATKGGDLGWVSTGELTASFEEAMSKLEPGATSEPVQSPFGWHLIQVLDRRETQMGSEATRGRARAQLVAQKSEERYDQWLRRLRDEAFVEILED